MLGVDDERCAGYLLGMGTQDFTEEERESLKSGGGFVRTAMWEAGTGGSQQVGKP